MIVYIITSETAVIKRHEVCVQSTNVLQRGVSEKINVATASKPGQQYLHLTTSIQEAAYEVVVVKSAFRQNRKYDTGG